MGNEQERNVMRTRRRARSLYIAIALLVTIGIAAALLFFSTLKVEEGESNDINAVSFFNGLMPRIPATSRIDYAYTMNAGRPYGILSCTVSSDGFAQFAQELGAVTLESQDDDMPATRLKSIAQQLGSRKACFILDCHGRHSEGFGEKVGQVRFYLWYCSSDQRLVIGIDKLW